MSRESSGFWEDGFRVTWTPGPAELAAAHALRAEVFCRELRWVGSPSDPQERDEFDEACIPVVVLDPAGRVVATVRLVEGGSPWMFDEIFRGLLPAEGTLDRGGMEASRLAVAPAARAVRLSTGRRVADLLFKSAYLLCRQHGVRNLYMVTSDAVARRFTTAGLPCFPLAAGTRMPDGVLAVPLVLDWGRLRDDAPIRAWFEGQDRGAPSRLEPERVRRLPVPVVAPAPAAIAGAQGWREQRVRASG